MLDALRHLVQDSLPGTPGAHSRVHPHDVRVAACARRDAAGQFVFTRQLVQEYDVAQRTVLAELLWEVAMADGSVDATEEDMIAELSAALELDPTVLARGRSGTPSSTSE